VEVYPGFAADEVLYSAAGAVVGVATKDAGIAKDGTPKATFERGVELRGRQTLFAEGARGSCAEALLARFDLRRAGGADVQHYGLGIKEVWEVPEGAFRKGFALHTLGYPLQSSPLDKVYGGAWMRDQRSKPVRSPRGSGLSSLVRRIEGTTGGERTAAPAGRRRELAREGRTLSALSNALAPTPARARSRPDPGPRTVQAPRTGSADGERAGRSAPWACTVPKVHSTVARLYSRARVRVPRTMAFSHWCDGNYAWRCTLPRLVCTPVQ
jgi:hypothetical protein